MHSGASSASFNLSSVLLMPVTSYPATDNLCNRIVASPHPRLLRCNYSQPPAPWRHAPIIRSKPRDGYFGLPYSTYRRAVETPSFIGRMPLLKQDDCSFAGYRELVFYLIKIRDLIFIRKVAFDLVIVLCIYSYKNLTNDINYE